MSDYLSVRGDGDRIADAGSVVVVHDRELHGTWVYFALGHGQVSRRRNNFTGLDQLCRGNTFLRSNVVQCTQLIIRPPASPIGATVKHPLQFGVRQVLRAAGGSRGAGSVGTRV